MLLCVEFELLVDGFLARFLPLTRPSERLSFAFLRAMP